MKALQIKADAIRFVLAKAGGVLLGRSSYYKGPFRIISLVDIPEPSLPSQAT